MAPAVIPEVLALCRPDDFFRPAHVIIMEAVERQHAAGLPADPVAIANVLTATGEIARVGGAPYLHTLIASVPAPVNGVYYAGIVADLSLRRRVEVAGTRIVQRAQAQDASVADILAMAEQCLAEATERHEPPGADAMNIADFTVADLPFGDPVIPGVLYEQNRVVLVAAEGSGKSELGMQAAVMTAAGLHVFTAERIDPQVSLVIDLENPTVNIQRRAARLLAQAERIYGWDPARCHVWSRPEGLDLHDASDARLLMSVITRVNPRLIVAGPVKKMALNRGESGEQLATPVTSFWDKVRGRLGSAVWLEHHAPFGAAGREREMRPMNSALWMSWPESGIGLYPLQGDAEPPGSLRVGTFRQHREDRVVWPAKLRRSSPWPWAGVYPEGTFTQRG